MDITIYHIVAFIIGYVTGPEIDNYFRRKIEESKNG